ncbi:hypothetical protein ACEQ8H_003557 [Pleosporales sp. CAS-2024a]
MSKTIHLHCPSTSTTVPNFIITPHQSPAQIYHSIRLALNIAHAVLYTTDARALTKLESIQDEQHILVAASHSEKMLPESPVEFEFYCGQELEGGEQWEYMGEREKAEHVSALVEGRSETRNRLRITRAWEGIEEDLKALQEGKTGSADDDEELVEQRWGISVEQFLPDSMKPAKVKRGGKMWDERVLAGLAALSSFTHGQARLAKGFLTDAVRLRVEDGNEDQDGVVTLEDVVTAVTIVFEKAGVIKEKVTKQKSAKAREKEKKKARKEKGRKGKMSGLE